MGRLFDVVMHDRLSAATEVALTTAKNFKIAASHVRLVYVQNLVKSTGRLLINVDELRVVAIFDDILVAFSAAVALPLVGCHDRSLF